MSQEIIVPITTDDTGILASFSEVQESAEELDETMGELGDSIDEAFTPPRNIKASNSAIKKNTKELKKNEEQTKKNSRASGKFVKQGGRGISMLSRLGGIGGKATQSLGGLAFALGSTPFGPFALTAAAASVAYSFFASKLGLDNDEIIKKNKELAISIQDLEDKLGVAFRSRQIQAIELNALNTEAEKRAKKLIVFEELRNDLLSERLNFADELLEKQNAAARAGDKTDTKSLEAKKAFLEADLKDEKLLSRIAATKNNIAQIDKDAAAERKAAAAARRADEAAAQRLFDSLIRDEEEKAINSLVRQQEARVKASKGVFSSKEQEARFILDSETLLQEDIAKVKAQFAAAEVKARQALLTQFVIDAEAAEIAVAESKAVANDIAIQDLKSNDTEKADLTKQNAEKLEADLIAIRAKFAEQRKAEGLAEQQEIFEIQLASFENNTLRMQAELDTRLILDQQAFEGITHTEEEITAFKEAQDQERLTSELNFQIARLKLVRDFNKQISTEESAALDAQIANLETRLQGVGAKVKATTSAKEGDGLFGLLGISAETQSDIQAVQGALEQVTAEISKAVAERVAILQEEIDFRNGKVDQAQANLDSQLELNRLGHASDVQGAKDSLAAQKSALDKAEKEKKEAAEAQFAIDTALQASNLVTAISGLYSSLSGLPFGIGVALATALSAVLIGTFISSKVSAANAAGFAEGGQYGYTGDGTKYQKSRALGEKPYDYHKGEFILDAETTKDLGIDGMHMTDARSHLLNMPSASIGKAANKRINKQIGKNHSESRKQQEQQVKSGIVAALKDNNSTLKKILGKPVAIPMGDGSAMLKYPNGSTEMINMKS